MNFSQTINTSDLILKCVKIFLRKFSWQRPKSSKNSLWRLHSERGTVIHPPFKKERLRNIGHTMVLDIKKCNFGNQSAYGFIFGLLWHFFKKCGRYYYKIATAILLQNATKVYYKMRQVFYYKKRQFAKCNSYYKMRRLLQNTLVHSVNTLKSELLKTTYFLKFLLLWLLLFCFN